MLKSSNYEMYLIGSLFQYVTGEKKGNKKHKKVPKVDKDTKSPKML